MDANQLAQTLVQRGGYNQIDAQNAAKGPRAQELAREFGLSGVQPGISSGNTDYASIARQSLQMQQEASKPAVESLQAQIPEIQKATQIKQQSLESQKAPLQARYQSIIDQLKGKETQETSAQQTALSQEYGKRGIPLQSGAFQQDLLGKTQQISQTYGGAVKDVGLSQEQDLMDIANKISELPITEAEQTAAIRNAIAQIQSGASSSAISNALTLYQNQQTANQATTTENRLQQAQNLAEQVANKPTTQVIEVGGRKKLINSQTGAVIQDLGSTASPVDTGESSELEKIFGGGTGINSLNLFSNVTGQNTQQKSNDPLSGLSSFRL